PCFCLRLAQGYFLSAVAMEDNTPFTIAYDGCPAIHTPRCDLVSRFHPLLQSSVTLCPIRRRRPALCSLLLHARLHCDNANRGTVPIRPCATLRPARWAARRGFGIQPNSGSVAVCMA